jgi:hypothetical protein
MLLSHRWLIHVLTLCDPCVVMHSHLNLVIRPYTIYWFLCKRVESVDLCPFHGVLKLGPL